jgi:hypothetical protein
LWSSYLRQDLEFLTSLVEINEAVGHRVGYSRVDHGQIRQKRPQVRDCSVTDDLFR